MKDIFFVVDAQAMVPTVGLSLLLLQMLPLMLAGVLVLLYHTKYQNRSVSEDYSTHGGRTGFGNDCGAFFVYLYVADSYSYWYFGAALVYQNRNYTCYTLHGGASSTDADCGVFCVFAYYVFSRSFWNLGAALSYKLYFVFDYIFY